MDIASRGGVGALLHSEAQCNLGVALLMMAQRDGQVTPNTRCCNHFRNIRGTFMDSE